MINTEISSSNVISIVLRTQNRNNHLKYMKKTFDIEPYQYQFTYNYIKIS